MISQAVNGFALSLYQAWASAIRKAPAQGDDQLMTVEDLAAYLKVKTQTLYDWARNKRIPCERASSEIRFRRSVIDQWLAESQRDKGEGGIEAAHARDEGVIESSRSFLRPQTRSKSNVRV